MLETWKLILCIGNKAAKALTYKQHFGSYSQGVIRKLLNQLQKVFFFLQNFPEWNLNYFYNDFNIKVGCIFFHLDACVDCAICQEKFSLDEEVRQLPCKHHYHFDCIEPWLKMVSIMSAYYE